MTNQELRHLILLAEKYPNITAAQDRIVSLSANLNLPKGTEHYISDIHGESEAFLHILRNASGVIKMKIDDLFSTTVSTKERRDLATLIYYPAERLDIVKNSDINLSEWYKISIYRLVELAHFLCIKYSRAYVRRCIEPQFLNIIEELIYGINETDERRFYYEAIIDNVIENDHADACIISMCNLITRLAVDQLHIIGDIYDRGPGADDILDALMTHYNVDIQWGNHDVIWMGAAAGSELCIATVIRMCARYDNIHTLEEGYGISMRPLISFALEAYRDDPCDRFRPKYSARDAMCADDFDTLAKLHKAIAVIQFKLEGQVARKRPEFDVEYKRLFEYINYEEKTITIEGETYPLTDCCFPTVGADDPYALTEGEQMMLRRMKAAFIHSERLQRHIRFLFSKGSMYTCRNGNLLYHGCLPMNEDGSFAVLQTPSGPKAGKELLDFCDTICRQGFLSKGKDESRQYALDFMWYLWNGPLSPLFGKNKMTTFERYFIEDKTPWKEKKNPYYDLIESPEFCDKILLEFGLGGPLAHILSGHMPVNKGSSPIHGGGKLLIIDGGFAKAYQEKTGIAGYTLIYNSWGMILTSHNPFESKQVAIEQEQDIGATTVLVQKIAHRQLIKDTDKGKELMEQIAELKALKQAYISGDLKQSV